MKKLLCGALLSQPLLAPLALAHAGHGMEEGFLHQFFHQSEILGAGLLLLTVAGGVYWALSRKRAKKLRNESGITVRF